MIALRYRLYLLGAFIVGIIGGAGWPPPPLPKSSDSTNSWSLPPLSDIARHNPKDLATVTTGIRWNSEAGGVMGENSAWTLAGIVRAPNPVALVMSAKEKDKVHRIGIGQPLPDGSVLQSVSGDQIATKLDTCITTYQLFQVQAIAKSDDCEKADVSDQGTSK